jgi:hypothetical protein
MSHKYHTTQKDFGIFKEESIYWIKKLGMLDWEWFFEWGDIEDRAEVEYDIENTMAQVTFSKNWGDLNPSPYFIRKCAFHEVMEVFFGTMATIAIKRDFNPSSLVEATHRMIRTMENTFYEEDFGRRYRHGKK